MTSQSGQIPPTARVEEASRVAFTGCIPGELRSVSSNDLDDINLVHCDVKLTDLVIEGATLSPAFSPDTTSYTVVVGPSPATVTASGQSGVTYEFLDNSNNTINDADTESGFQVALGSGRTTVKVKVSSEDGQVSHTYVVNIDRASAPGRPSISGAIQPTPGVAGSLDLAWTAPTSDGGAPAIAYDVRYIESAASDKADVHWTVDEDAWTTGDGNPEATIMGLLGDTEHDVQVRAYNGAERGPWSQTAKGTPDAPDCDAGGPITDPVSNPGLVTDCEALLAAMASLGASGTVNWSINTLMSNWQYVTIGGTPQRVTKLELTSLSLDGRVPSSLRQLSGLTTLDLSDNELTQGIPHRLGELSNLQEMLLGGNMLGGAIPPELGDLSSLEVLELDSNGLTGQIPSNLRNLSSLTAIEVNDNQLDGSLPSWLGQISGLKTLSLHSNGFTGSVPSSLGSLSSLEELYLAGNKLTGTIPTQLGNATALTGLTMGNNQLRGSIPSQLSSLTSLTQLALNSNQLGGSIPDLSALTSLTELHLNGNQLTGGVPTWLGDLTELTALDLSGNDLGGEIPTELNSLTKLESLNLGGNGLTGGIPSFASLTALVNLDLSDNALTGEIPTVLGDLGVLETLVLSDNALSGSIPAKVGSLSNLEKLHLARNDLSEELPDELNNLTELLELDLSENDLEGEIPTLSGLTKLEELKLNNSGLEGEIPALSSLTELRILHLNDNELDESIPSLSGLTDLEELYLQGNELTGGLSSLSRLSSLRELIAFDNKLDGSISTLPSGLTSLEILSLGDNQLTGSLPSTLGGFSSLEVLSVANNSLSGSIPSQLGNLDNLRWLNLYSNQISGSIPSRLGDLTNLERLRLEKNALTGAIPAQLGKLDSLILLRLADNQLTGCVPGELMSLPALGEGETNDLEAVGLPFCPAPAISSVEASTQSLTVEWNTPTAYEDYVESYDLRRVASSVQDPEEDDWTVVETNSTATRATVTGLEQRTEYDVQVRAVYEAGDGAWSESFTQRTRQSTVNRGGGGGGGGTPPVVTDDECADDLGALSGTATRSGTWADDCESDVSGRGYARYYSFTLTESTEVTIGLTSSVDTYLFLRSGSSTSGLALHQNDDIVSGNTNSQIVATLAAGTYTIEATTYSPDTTGSFTLSVAGGSGGGTPVATGCDPATLTLPASGISGTWADDCESDVSGRGYARYYSFTLSESAEVTIDLTSSVDTYLFLRSGSSTSGTALHQNDDIVSGNTNSQIVATLSAGAYTIEATTYSPNTTGSFTLSVVGGESGSSSGGGTPVATGCDPATLTLPVSGVSGTWADDCESDVSGRGYARYYSFTLSESAEVTINLTSTVDTYLFLRSGSSTSGTALHQNDDIVSGNTNSQIVATLSAGTYTIEATTYSPDTTGSFTLSVAGGDGGNSGGGTTPTGCNAATLTLPASGVSGSWADDCESSVTGRGYARYYSFTLSESTEVTINLTSTVDTYLFLRSGSATSGSVLHQNDDIVSGNTNSQIVATLSAGAYTIEATTYSPNTTGSFTLSVSGGGSSGGGGTPVATGCNPAPLTLPATGVSGSWADDCESSVTSRGYARYYSFTLSESAEVTINLESEVDTYLFLRSGSSTSGSSLHQNDDIVSGNTNSQIVATLSAGTYTIEATTYSPDTTGSFSLSVTGGDGGSSSGTTLTGCDPATLTLPASEVSGSWAGDCESGVTSRGYARYYSFTLTESAEVTIDLTSTVDTYLFLRSGSSTSGTAIHQNDDIVSGNTNSQIVATLSAGAYTIEATTYSPNTTGSFTLSVAGGGGGSSGSGSTATGCNAATLTLPASGVSGSWADDCESSVTSRGYARYYSFTLAESAEVTIDLTSSVDTYLFLRSGTSTSGTALHQNDDIGGGNRNSQIVATLAAGTYTIEATTYNEATTGSFTLSVSGGGG